MELRVGADRTTFTGAPSRDGVAIVTRPPPRSSSSDPSAATGAEKSASSRWCEEKGRPRDAKVATAPTTPRAKAKQDALDELGDEGPAASHADLLTRIRNATEGLAKLTEGLD